MATAGIVHFSDFPSATNLTGAEALVGLQSGQNVQVTPTQLLSFMLTTPGTLTNKTVSTAPNGDSSGAVASTQFVAQAIAPLAPTNAPTFTGEASFAGATFDGVVTFSGASSFTGPAASFTARPTFNGATPWDSRNLPSPLQATGGATSGALTVAGAGNRLIFDYNQNGNQTYIFQGSGNNLNLAYGLFESASGMPIATANSGSAISISDIGFSVSVFSAAAIGGSVTTVPVFGVNGTAFTCGVPAGFASRPTFAGATPWDSANLANPMVTTGGAFTGTTSVAGAGANMRFSFNQHGNDAYVYQGSGDGFNIGFNQYQSALGVSTVAAEGSGGQLSIGSGSLSLSNWSGGVAGSPVPANVTMLLVNGNGLTLGAGMGTNPVVSAASGSYIQFPTGAYFSSATVPVYVAGTLAVRGVLENDEGILSIAGNVNFASARPTVGGKAVCCSWTGSGSDGNDHLVDFGWNGTNIVGSVDGGGAVITLASTNAGASFAGSLSATLFAADANAYFTVSGSAVYFNANPSTFMNFDRSSNAWNWYVGGEFLMNLNSSGLLDVAGNGSFNDVQIRSDVRIKVVQSAIHDATDLIQRTQPYRGTKNGEPGFFLIAQEAREVTPELVHASNKFLDDDPNPLLSLDLLSYVPILLEEVKRLRQEVEALKATR